MRVFALILAVALAALAAGCGVATSGNSANKFNGEAQQAAQTIEDLQSAGQKSDEAKICNDLLAQALRSKLGNCQTTVKTAIKNTDSFDLTVQSVQVTGASATAKVRAKRGGSTPDEIDTVGLVREGGRWRISSLG
jgi:copper chaperone CopZ